MGDLLAGSVAGSVLDPFWDSVRFWDPFRDPVLEKARFGKRPRSHPRPRPSLYLSLSLSLCFCHSLSLSLSLLPLPHPLPLPPPLPVPRTKTITEKLLESQLGPRNSEAPRSQLESLEVASSTPTSPTTQRLLKSILKAPTVEGCWDPRIPSSRPQIAPGKTPKGS